MSRSNTKNSHFIFRAISKMAAVALFLLLFSANAMAAYTTVAFLNSNQWVNGWFTSGSNTTTLITSPTTFYFIATAGNKTASNASGWAYLSYALAAPPVPQAYTGFQVATNTTNPFDISAFDVNNQTGGAYAITVTSYSDPNATIQIATQNISVPAGISTVTLNGNHLSAATTKIIFASTASISFNNFQLQFSTGRRVTANPSGTTAGTVTITSNTGGVNCTWNGTAQGSTCTSGVIASGTAVTLTAALPAGTTIAWGTGCDTTTATTCTINSLTANTTISPVTTSSAVTFTGATGTPFGDWLLSGNATFTTATQADTTSGTVVQLTPNLGTQAGMLVYNKPFSSAFGDTITFDYYMPSTTGADGIAFFLVDGTQTTVTLGKSGGTLGYGTNYSTTNGVPKAYAAVGFDVYGNGNIEFGNASGTGTNNGARTQNNVVIVGSAGTTSLLGYRYLAGSVQSTIAGGWRKAEVTVKRAGAAGCAAGVCLSARFSTDNGATWTTVHTNQRIDNLTGQAVLPDTFKLGFSASTGAVTDVHYIDNVVIDLGGFQLDIVKAGTGTGTVTSTSSSSQAMQVNCGATCAVAYLSGEVVTLTANPDVGSNFTSWSGACSGTNATTTVTMSAAQSCTATFTNVGSFTVTTTATGGTITSTNNPTVTNGSTTTVTGTANANYYFTGVSGCGGTAQNNTNQATTNFSYTTGAITGACTVTATFAIKTYTVTPSAGAGGTITPSTAQTINHGSTTTFTVTPTTGYTASVGGSCGGTLVGTTYTTNAITTNCSVTASFTLNSYTVTTQANNGTIDTTNNPSVNHGSTTTVTGTASANYYFTGVSGCGGTTQSNTNQATTTFSYTTGAITGTCTVTANFAITTFTVTFNSNGGSAVTSQTVNYNTTASSPTAPTKTGYTFAGWYSDSGLTTVFNFATAITVNTTLYAKWTINTYTVTANATGNGTGTAASNTGGINYTYQTASTGTTSAINYGTNVVLTATAGTGSTVSWTTCTGTAAGNGTTSATCTFSSLAANETAQATFTLNTYTVTATAAGNGTGTVISSTGGISYTYNTVNTGTTSALNYGTSVTLTATAGTGSTVSWSGTCTTAGGTEGGTSTAATCTFSSLTANKTATATFTLNTYTVTANANGNGTGTVTSGTGGISYTYQTANTGATSAINYGTSVVVTATAGTGSTVSWAGVCTTAGGTEANNNTTSATCTFTSLTANKTVAATFTLNTYTLTYNAGANGSITGTTPQTVNHGANGTAVTPAPATNYHFVNWSDSSTANPRTDTNVTGNITVTANFAINTYTVTTTAINGAITSATNPSVNYGATTTVTGSACRS